MGAAAKEVYIAQTYAFGEEAQVDWYEAYANFAGDEQKVYATRLTKQPIGIT
jgi:hypothetical protein